MGIDTTECVPRQRTIVLERTCMTDPETQKIWSTFNRLTGRWDVGIDPIDQLVEDHSPYFFSSSEKALAIIDAIESARPRTLVMTAGTPRTAFSLFRMTELVPYPLHEGNDADA